MQFTINTASTTMSDFPDPHTVVTLSHLRSYERMGQASAPCPAPPASIRMSDIMEVGREEILSQQENGVSSRSVVIIASSVTAGSIVTHKSLRLRILILWCLCICFHAPLVC